MSFAHSYASVFSFDWCRATTYERNNTGFLVNQKTSDWGQLSVSGSKSASSPMALQPSPTLQTPSHIGGDIQLTPVNLADSSLVVQEIPRVISLVVLGGVRARDRLDDRDSVRVHWGGDHD